MLRPPYMTFSGIWVPRSPCGKWLSVPYAFPKCVCSAIQRVDPANAMELNTKQMQPKHVQSPHPGTWIKRGSLQVDLNRQGLLGIELLESVITSFNLRQAKITMMMETLSCDYPTLYIYMIESRCMFFNCVTLLPCTLCLLSDKKEHILEIPIPIHAMVIVA